MIKIDARGVEGGFDYEAYLAEYYAGLPTGASTYHGGEPDTAFGGEYYVSGPQVSFSYGEAAQLALVEGSELAYDFIHNGPQFGHGITGNLDKVTFGYSDEDTTTVGGDPNGKIRGLAKELVISGLDLNEAPGAGTGADNDVYQLYSAIQRAGIDAGKFDVLDTYFFGAAQLLLGSDGDDVFTAGAFADKLVGNDGDDVLAGAIGDDRINGGAGADSLAGGAGSDRIFGGEGSDTFVLGADAAGGVDVIRDFEAGEQIDVSALDLAFIGADPFSGTGAELSVSVDGRKSVLEADIDGDGVGDLSVVVRGYALGESDVLF